MNAQCRPRADDAGRTQIRRRRNRRGFVHPDVLADFGVFRRVKRRTDAQDFRLDARKRLPRIGKLPQVIRRQSVVKVVKLFDCQHNLPPIYYVDCFFALRRRISQSMSIASSSPASAPDESSSTSCHLPVRPATKS